MKELKLKEGLILTFNQEDEFNLEGKKIIIKPVWKWMIGGLKFLKRELGLMVLRKKKKKGMKKILELRKLGKGKEKKIGEERKRDWGMNSSDRR